MFGSLKIRKERATGQNRLASAGEFFPHSSRITTAETVHRSPTQSGRRACPLSFPVSQPGTNNPFSAYGGTAGQRGLSRLDTTIKCPTQVSHFWDERDTLGRKGSECKLPLVSALRWGQAKAFTLNFFLGQRDMGQNWDGSGCPVRCPTKNHFSLPTSPA